MIKNLKTLLVIFPIISIIGCAPKEKLNPQDDFDYDGLINEIDNSPKSNKNSFSFSGNFGGKTVKTGSIDFNLDYRFFVDENPSEYNRNLACWALMMAGDIYSAESSIISNAVYETQGRTNYETLYKQLGCTGFVDTVLSADEYENDKDDLTRFITAYHDFSYNNEQHKLIIVTVEGTNGSNQWCSNFDVGNSTESYTTSTGTHAEWTHANNHKGFDVCANRVYDKVTNIYSENNVEPIYFVVGHSRGAAVANLLAKQLTDDGYKTFGYTFATPLTTCDNAYSTYTNIHNFVNSDDLVTKLPLEIWGFKRFGNVIKASVGEEKQAIYKKLNPSISYEFTAESAYISGLNSVCATRDALYDFSEESFTLSEEFDSSEDVISSFNNGMASLPEYKKYFKLEPVLKENGKWALKIYLSPQLVFAIMTAFITGEGGSVIRYLPLMTYAQPYYNALIKLATAKIEVPHLPSTYLALL